MLYACNANTSPSSPADSSPKTQVPSDVGGTQSAVMPSLAMLEIPSVGVARQVVAGDDGLLIINDKNELWRVEKPTVAKPQVQKLADDVLPIPPVAAFGKVAWVDKDGSVRVLAGDKQYRHSTRPSPTAKMLMLPTALLVVQDDGGVGRLVRLEMQDNQWQMTASFSPVLPDARPVQVDFVGAKRGDGSKSQGEIAILSHPDDTTYPHGVLGDDIEGGQLQVLTDRTLTPSVKPLGVDGLVFEGNTVQVLPHDKGEYLIATLAGDGQGARVVMVDKADGKLNIIAQSTPLPVNRWQSPFVFDGRLYAVQMPHLVGRLVQYTKTQKTLIEQALGEGYSNHAIGAFETNLATANDTFAIIPKRGYRQVAILGADGTLREQSLPASIIATTKHRQTLYWLLDNGQIWWFGVAPTSF